MSKSSWKIAARLLPLACLSILPAAQAQSGPATPAIYERLQRAGLIDPYFPEVIVELATPLAQAAQGKWKRVQVNAPWRADALNIYQVDAEKIPPDFSLENEGIAEFSLEMLSGGALSSRRTQTIFLNTTASKRAAAVAVLQRISGEPLIKSLARVDAAGLAASEKLWSPATFANGSKPVQNAILLLRGSTTFVLAHEMGHLLASEGAAPARPVVRARSLTDRQKDERAACPEMLVEDFQIQRAAESAADLAATRLLGLQCRIGSDAAIRHEVNQLGMQWYFLGAMSDKMLQAARRTQSPIIARQLQIMLGPELYQQAVVAPSSGDRKAGAVKPLFPASHPPDYARVQAIEEALAKSPCGGQVGDHSLEQMMENYRLQMCRGLVADNRTR